MKINITNNNLKKFNSSQVWVADDEHQSVALPYMCSLILGQS